MTSAVLAASLMAARALARAEMLAPASIVRVLTSASTVSRVGAAAAAMTMTFPPVRPMARTRPPATTGGAVRGEALVQRDLEALFRPPRIVESREHHPQKRLPENALDGPQVLLLVGRDEGECI